MEFFNSFPLVSILSSQCIKNMMMEEVEGQRLNYFPVSEVLGTDFEWEVQENGSRQSSKERCCGNFREIVPHLGQFYFQQMQKGRMKMVAMELVPEYPSQNI